jgi:hypothetical protein
MSDASAFASAALWAYASTLAFFTSAAMVALRTIDTL